MPVTTRWIKEILEITLQGANPPEDVIGGFERAVADPASPEKFFVLLDVRKSESLATRPKEDIIRVAEHLGPYKQRVERVAVLATEDVHFGLSRMGAVYSEAKGVLTDVFRDRDKAVAWLRGDARPE